MVQIRAEILKLKAEMDELQLQEQEKALNETRGLNDSLSGLENSDSTHSNSTSSNFSDESTLSGLEKTDSNHSQSTISSFGDESTLSSLEKTGSNHSQSTLDSFDVSDSSLDSMDSLGIGEVDGLSSNSKESPDVTINQRPLTQKNMNEMDLKSFSIPNFDIKTNKDTHEARMRAKKNNATQSTKSLKGPN